MDARGLFMRGIELADEQRWGEAVQFFERSRQLQDRPSTVFNLAVALYRMARYSEAIVAFDDFVRVSDTTADAQNRAQANQMRSSALRSLATLILRVSPDAATVSVDGRMFEGTGAAREFGLDPGPHHLSIAADGFQAQSLSISPLSGARLETQVTLAPLVTPAVAASTEPALDPAPTPQEQAVERSLTTPTRATAASGEASNDSILASPVFWAVVGAVVVGAGVGIGVAVAGSGGDAAPYGGSSGVVVSL